MIGLAEIGRARHERDAFADHRSRRNPAERGAWARVESAATATVKVAGALTPVFPAASRCEACTVYVPGASPPKVPDQAAVRRLYAQCLHRGLRPGCSAAVERDGDSREIIRGRPRGPLDRDRAASRRAATGGRGQDDHGGAGIHREGDFGEARANRVFLIRHRLVAARRQRRSAGVQTRRLPARAIALSVGCACAPCAS